MSRDRTFVISHEIMTFKFAGKDGKDIIIPFGFDPIEAMMGYIVRVDELGGCCSIRNQKQDRNGLLALHELELNSKAGNILIEGRRATLEDIAKLFTDLSLLLSLYSIAIFP